MFLNAILSREKISPILTVRLAIHTIRLYKQLTANVLAFIKFGSIEYKLNRINLEKYDYVYF